MNFYVEKHIYTEHMEAKREARRREKKERKNVQQSLEDLKTRQGECSLLEEERERRERRGRKESLGTRRERRKGVLTACKGSVESSRGEET